MLACGLDLGARNLRCCYSAVDGAISFPFPAEAGFPTDLLTIARSAGAPAFPGLLARVGVDAPVEIRGREGKKPHMHLRDLFTELRARLWRPWGMPQSLGVVVSTHANDLQRSLILKSAETAGWLGVRLVNKTTAAAFHTLTSIHSGKYLVIVLGYGPAEASVVQISSDGLQVLSHAYEPAICGARMDEICLAGVLLPALSGNGVQPDAFSAGDWMWLRDRAETVRSGLSSCRPVVLGGVPARIAGGAQLELRFSVDVWTEAVKPVLEALPGLVAQCCDQAGSALPDLQGCIATGGLLMDPLVRNQLRSACGAAHLSILPVEAQILGACALAKDEQRLVAAAKHSENTDMPEAAALRIPAESEPGEEPDPVEPMLRTVSAFVRKLQSSSAAADDARALLIKTHLEELARNIRQTATLFQDLANSPEQPRAVNPADGLTRQSLTQSSLNQELQRRKLALANQAIRRAEKELSRDRLEQAVQCSHAAAEASNDASIFRAMISIHLGAAAKRPPALATFPEDRTWLICALQDDPSSYAVQQALAARFFTHASQLADIATAEAKGEAWAILDELAELLPTANDTQHVRERLGWEMRRSEAGQS